MKDQIVEIIKRYLDVVDITIDIPRNPKFGDYSTNIALIEGKKLAKNPRTIATELVEKLKTEPLFSQVEVAGPGFINFTLKDSVLQDSLKEIIAKDREWGKGTGLGAGLGKGILLEYVSANPTGPLHVGHGRWAVVGDIIARALRAAGYKVDCEYYVNDVGNQINKLVGSIEAARNNQPVPEGGYGGAYIKLKAQNAKLKTKEDILNDLLNEQKTTLNSLGVKFDKWFHESELHKNKEVDKAIEKLRQHTFKEKGAVWFKSTDFGDDKDRVVVRESGQTTYFAADIAYHLNKFARQYDHLINIWGADHHGYVMRVKSAMKALGQPDDRFEILIGQLVTLYRGNEPVRMSKRTGEMVTLSEVVEEVGADATRFFFAATDINSHLDFDLELAKKKSNDNPVYYVQYAHARIHSIMRKSENLNPKSELGIDLSELTHPAERTLMLKLISWPDVIQLAAKMRQPHKITEYGKELAVLFHSFYEKCKVLGNPARLVLVDASRITLRNVLELLGITAPKSM